MKLFLLLYPLIFSSLSVADSPDVEVEYPNKKSMQEKLQARLNRLQSKLNKTNPCERVVRMTSMYPHEGYEIFQNDVLNEFKVAFLKVVFEQGIERHIPSGNYRILFKIDNKMNVYDIELLTSKATKKIDFMKKALIDTAHSMNKKFNNPNARHCGEYEIYRTLTWDMPGE